MSENITTTSAATSVQPIPSTASAVETPKTTEMQKCARCEHNYFQPGGGYVAELAILYGAVRGTEVAKSKPLTAEEIKSQAICGQCKRLATFKTYPTSSTICLMEGWRRKNEEWAAKRAEERRQRQVAAVCVAAGVSRKVIEEVSDDPLSLAQAIKTEDKHEINRIIVEGGRPYHSHKSQRKRSKGPRHQNVQPEEPSNHKKGGKDKNKNSQKKGGKKGRK